MARLLGLEVSRWTQPRGRQVLGMRFVVGFLIGLLLGGLLAVVIASQLAAARQGDRELVEGGEAPAGPAGGAP